VHTAQVLTAEYTGPLVGLYLAHYLRANALAMPATAMVDNAMYLTVFCRVLFAAVAIRGRPAGAKGIPPVRAASVLVNYAAMIFIAYNTASMLF
jgi:hypothetical protein